MRTAEADGRIRFEETLAPRPDKASSAASSTIDPVSIDPKLAPENPDSAILYQLIFAQNRRLRKLPRS